MSDVGPGVRLPPPVVVAGALALAWLLGWLVPWRIGPPAPLFAGVLVLAALFWLGWALLLMRRAGTDPRPFRPDTAMVLGGPFRFGRNPIYLGFVGIMAGLALAWATPWAWLAVMGVFLWLDRFVIRREEAYLTARFGGEYTAYAARVRRWL